MTDAPVGVLHHVELWVPDLDRAVAEWGRLLGRTPMFAERRPWTGGPEHYAGYLENSDGFEVELVARSAGNP
jgi:catechol 2,3-dioxygenase-like lactoylglutathione lyase family enzyme